MTLSYDATVVKSNTTISLTVTEALFLNCTTRTEFYDRELQRHIIKNSLTITEALFLKRTT
jgi:hypothetical protein